MQPVNVAEVSFRDWTPAGCMRHAVFVGLRDDKPAGQVVPEGCAPVDVRHLAGVIPQRFVAKSGPANCRGRIFVDDLRNGEGATPVAAYSPRARPGLAVSMPVAWDEQPQVSRSAQGTVATALRHVQARAADPWAGMTAPAARQSISDAMRTLGLRPQARPGPAG